jgi:hypothetical protein
MIKQHDEQPIRDGEMLKKHVEQSPLLAARVAEQMGISQGTLTSYYARESLRTSVLRDAALVLKYNFFFDLGMSLPDGLPSALDTAARRRIAELEKENERLRIENAVYEKIMKR